MSIFFLVISIPKLLFFTAYLVFTKNTQVLLFKLYRISFVKVLLEQNKILRLQTFESISVKLISSDVNTARELQEICSTKSFSSFIEILSISIQIGNFYSKLRIFLSLVFHQLQSDIEDMAIWEVDKTLSGESVKNLSTSLTIESLKYG